MRKALLIALFFLLFLAPLAWAAQAPVDPITLKATSKGEWSMVNPDGQVIGTLKAIEEGAYSITLSNGQYVGLISREGLFQKPGRRQPISADEARIFLDTLDAMKKMK